MNTRLRTYSRAPLTALSTLALALALSACGREESQTPTAAPTPAPTAAETVPAPATGANDPASNNSVTPGASTAQGSMGQAADATRDAAGSAASSAAVALDDTGITAKVKTELAKDSELSALAISVETNGGQVTLTGPAPSAQAKERAEGLAKAVEGVKGVTNKLEVKAAG